MPRKQSDVERSLSGKGFQHREGDHNYFNYYSKAGKKTAVFTNASHGAREIDDSLLGRMARLQAESRRPRPAGRLPAGSGWLRGQARSRCARSGWVAD